MIGFGSDLAVGDTESIIHFAAQTVSNGFACTEFQTLDRRYSIDNLGNPAFYAAEHGFAQSSGEAGNGAFNLAANAVSLQADLFNPLAHGLTGSD